MSGKKKPATPEYQWQVTLIADYYDYRWRQVLDPLCEQFQQWKKGELDHEDLSEAIHRTRKKTQEVYTLFLTKREMLAKWIQLDRDWFSDWLKTHPAPPEVTIIRLD